jgi:putative transposase
MNAFWEVKPGIVAEYDGKRYLILRLMDLRTVLGKPEAGGQVECLQIHSLKPPSPEVKPPELPVEEISLIPEKEWEEAKHRYEIIKPLLEMTDRTKQAVADRAKAFNTNKTSIYKWIDTFLKTGKVSSLLNQKRGWSSGKKRISEEVLLVLDATISDYYLTEQRRSIPDTALEVQRRCRVAKLPAPHINTVRRRIEELPLKLHLEKRGEKKKAARLTNLIRGEFPGAEAPLSVVQIDHTKVDLILVDDLNRLPIGRPWITLAIDVFSRMVLGFHISLDPPGSAAVGMCLAHAILPKENRLAKLGIGLEWPCWGVPGTIHADNAREFRGVTLQRACQEYGIHLEWRPVTKPHYGGHIERLLGTLSKKIHQLPGTTFSNVAERGEYPSEKNAVFTLSEFEGWLIRQIAGVYHNEFHSGIGTTPNAKFKQGILGTDESPGTGLPRLVEDESRLLLDFLPFVERAVNPYGIVIERINYYHDLLRSWVSAPDPEFPKQKRKFIVKLDPRDIGSVYFYDPDLKQYFQIPYRNPSRPPMSLWELRAVERRLKEEGKKHVDEDTIFATLEQMRQLQENATTQTKAARRARQRRDEYQRAEKPNLVPEPVTVAPVDPPATPRKKILPFEEMEELRFARR